MLSKPRQTPLYILPQISLLWNELRYLNLVLQIKRYILVNKKLSPLSRLVFYPPHLQWRLIRTPPFPISKFVKTNISWFTTRERVDRRYPHIITFPSLINVHARAGVGGSSFHTLWRGLDYLEQVLAHYGPSALPSWFDDFLMQWEARYLLQNTRRI